MFYIFATDMTDRKSIWEAALVPGLVLGAIPAICTVLTGLLDGWQPQGSGLVLLKTAGSMFIWAAKLSCCIAAFRIFMIRFRGAVSAGGSDLFRFGAAVALLSAIIFSGFYLAYSTYINPDMFDETIALFRTQILPQMDANSRQNFEDMLPSLPRTLFFANLTYCFCFGTVLSAIFSSKLKK